MISDRQYTRDFAHELTGKLIEMMCLETKNFNGKDDPVEHVYLILNIVSCFMAKMAMSLEGFSHIYFTKIINTEKSIDIINKMCNEFIEFNKENSDFFKAYQNNQQVMQ